MFHSSLLKKVACFFLELGAPLFLGLASFHSPLAIIEAESRVVAEKSKENSTGLSYSTVNYGKESYGTVISAFGGVWARNFSGYMQSLPVSLDDAGTGLRSFTASFDCAEAEEKVFVGNALYYLYQKELARFETLCINVYQKEWVSPAQLQPASGFVYLPDYYADRLIEASPEINNYDDLLPLFSEGGELVSKYLNISTDIGERQWAVAGIYHCSGFDLDNMGGKTFSYNDLNFGEAFNSLGLPMLIAFDSSFSAEYLNGILTVAQPKPYILEQHMRNLSTFDKGNAGLSCFFQVESGQVSPMEDSALIYSQSHNLPSFLFIVYCCFALFCLIGVLFLGKASRSMTAREFFFTSAPLILILGFCSSLLKNWLGTQILGVSIFFSFYFGISLLALSLISAVLIALKAKKEGSNGQRQ